LLGADFDLVRCNRSAAPLADDTFQRDRSADASAFSEMAAVSAKYPSSIALRQDEHALTPEGKLF
jgi:hypothetical protein